MTRRPPRSTHLPYTTRFRSKAGRVVLAAAPDALADGVGEERPGGAPALVVARVEDGVVRVEVRRRLARGEVDVGAEAEPDRKSTRLNSSHANISYAVFCLKK